MIVNKIFFADFLDLWLVSCVTLKKLDSWWTHPCELMLILWWLSWLGRLVAKLVAPSCYGSSLGSNSDISQKYKLGDISKRAADTL
jgi:hypothetical protein